MHNLLPLLQLALGAADELGVRTDGVVVAGAPDGAAELGDLAGGLVEGDDVAALHLLPGERLDHLAAELVDGLHVGGLEGEAPGLGGGRGG